MAFLSCERVSKYYKLRGTLAEGVSTQIIPSTRTSKNSFVALEGIDFTLADGDRLGVIGLNGAGKSTLMRVISGIVKPSAGRVKVGGSIASILEPGSLLQSDLTGIENIYFQGRMTGVPEKTVKERLPEIVGFSGLGSFINQPIKNYSMGMSLRLSMGILRELQPDILLLDEVLAMGDIKFRESMSELFTEALKSIPIVILVSHELTEIFAKCNKCLVLKDGRMEFFGSVEDALRHYTVGHQTKQERMPADRSFKVGDIWFLDEERRVKVSKPIELGFYVEVMQEREAIDPVIYISGNAGNAVTDCPIYRESYTRTNVLPGLYLYKVCIPPHLLNTGRYYVHLEFGNMEEVVLRYNNGDTFEVVPDDWEMNNKWNLAPNYPVRPHLEWKLDYRAQ